MNAIQKIRKDQGLSLRALAEKSGVSADTIFHIEHGNRKPKADTLEKLARALGVGIETLLGDPSEDDWQAGISDLDTLDHDDLMAVFRARSDRWQRLKEIEASLPEGSQERQQAASERKRAHSRVLDAMNALMSRPEIGLQVSDQSPPGSIFLEVGQSKEGVS